MKMLVPLLEEIVSDVVFSGTDEIRSDVIEKIRSAANICRELNMETGESICKKLEECAGEADSERTADAVCRLCFYTECISNQPSV